MQQQLPPSPHTPEQPVRRATTPPPAPRAKRVRPASSKQAEWAMRIFRVFEEEREGDLVFRARPDHALYIVHGRAVVGFGFSDVATCVWAACEYAATQPAPEFAIVELPSGFVCAAACDIPGEYYIFLMGD